MPVYVFEDASGDVLEASFAVADRPDSLERDGKVYRRVLAPVSFAIGDSMMEPADFDRKFGKGAAALMASDRDHRKKTDGPMADHGFKGPEWLRPK